MRTCSIIASIACLTQFAYAGSLHTTQLLSGSSGGTVPLFVSGNGMYSVGTALFPSPATPHLVRWSATGEVEDLGTVAGELNVIPSGVSADGSVIAGNTGRAFRWTAATGIVPLIDTTVMVRAFGVSGDGSVIVGYFDIDPFRWTLSGYETLGMLPGNMHATAWAANRDGSVIAGNTYGGGDRPFVWTRSGGVVPIGYIGTGFPITYAYDISADGTTIVGHGFDQSDIRAFRWRSETGMRVLEPLAGMTQAIANATNGDGSIVVGNCWSNGGDPAFHAAMWSTTLGTIDLNTYFPTFGIDLTGWVLTNVNDVSDDGMTFVGYGTHNGVVEGWIAHLACSADFNNDGVLDMFDYIDFVEAFAIGNVSADFNKDGLIDFFDYLDFLIPFSNGC